MRTQLRRNGAASEIWRILRPVLIGVVVAAVVTITLVAVFSLVLALLKQIAQAALVPLAIVAAAVGCFAGAYVCAGIARKRGLLLGAIVALVLFGVICLISVCTSDSTFGTQSVFKLVIMLLVGGCAGYLGVSSARSRR